MHEDSCGANIQYIQYDLPVAAGDAPQQCIGMIKVTGVSTLEMQQISGLRMLQQFDVGARPCHSCDDT